MMAAVEEATVGADMEAGVVEEASRGGAEPCWVTSRGDGAETAGAAASSAGRGRAAAASRSGGTEETERQPKTWGQGPQGLQWR